MPRLRTGLILAACLAVGTVAAWRLATRDAAPDGAPERLAPFALDARPQADRYLFDYAGALPHYEEGAHEYLKRLASRFHIEALIVSLPGLPDGHTVETLAVDLVNGWRVGAAHEGRGLLLLLVDDTKQVKLEVTYALEDVFTDAFSGYVEDVQLGPYYRAGDAGTGLIAVMEMLEERARIKAQGGYTPGQIAEADAELLAGGAGAKRSLDRYAAPASPGAAPRAARGARSPEEAWQIMLASWAGEGVEADVYSEMTRLAMGDQDQPDPRTLKWLEHWRSADHRVLRQGDHAVVWFGAVDGWENAPFLFCDTGEGWKFDIVHQRRLVVMGEAPRWQVAQGPYPYVALMREARQSTAKDLPLAGADLYRCKDDAAIAARMTELQATLADEPDAIGATLELMRLYVVTGQRPKLVRPLIERAKALAPDRAEPWKYSAIYNVNSFMQYRTALADIERYLALRPDDPFGHDVKGFLYYRMARYADSIEALERAAALDPDGGYAYALMARDYAMLAREASALAKDRYRKRALAMRGRAASAADFEEQRLAWLDGWLERRL